MFFMHIFPERSYCEYRPVDINFFRLLYSSIHWSSALSLNPFRVSCLSVKGQDGTKLMTIAIDRLDRSEHITHVVKRGKNGGNVTGTQGESLWAVHPSPPHPLVQVAESQRTPPWTAPEYPLAQNVLFTKCQPLHGSTNMAFETSGVPVDVSCTTSLSSEEKVLGFGLKSDLLSPNYFIPMAWVTTSSFSQ